MVAEAAALRLGGTVATAAGRWWLGGKRREQERQLPMEELIRLRVPGMRLQREVRQQFEQITNAVFDRLEPFLRHAFSRLEDGGRQAVLDAVADTFARADLSDEALLDHNVQPAELTRAITGSVRGPVGLNEAETRLYEILFAECVEYYVRIVRSLPAFQERATSELLARTATLGGEVARLLERLPDRSLLAPDGTDQDTAFRRQYLELVSRDLDEVELFRRTSEQAAAPRVRLSVGYVSLRAVGDDGGRRRVARALPAARPDMSDWEEHAGAGDGSGTRVEAALRDASRVLLRGEAGSGKTTLLRWLAIMAARGSFQGELAGWNGLTPILVKLREYSGRALPDPKAMLDGIAGPITGIMPRGWVERQLTEGRVLLLIDGVDELLERERRAVRDWLRRLLGQYQARVVVTSRPAAAGAEWLRREDFTALHLERMTPPDLAAFVRQWHQAVRELDDELPCPVDELPRYEQSLLASLKDRAHLQSLAGTPLLAAMLCAMHLNRGRHLPRDRMELYRNALHALVHDRDADRNVPSAMDSELSLGDKLVVLRDLAWRLSDNNRSEIDLDRAAGYVTAKLRAMRHLDVLDGGRVLEQLRHRSGVLRSPAADRVDFVHRTFQEYLAAEEAAEEDRIGNLVGRAHLDQWRETVIMTAGHANTRQREELLDGILDRADAEPRHARTLRLLAAACQETLPSVGDTLATRLDGAVSHLLPARRKTDPPALAAVGPGLLRRLPTSLDALTEKAAAQTVRTVALIGGEDALRLLAGYVGDERDGVINELIAAWDYFDADGYVDAVLLRLPLAERAVQLNHSGQLRAAGRLRTLTHVHVNAPVRELGFATDLPPLTELWVGNHQGETPNLTALLAQPALERLTLLGETRVRSAEPLGELKELEWLGLGVSAEADLAVLHTLPKLREVLLSHDGIDSPSLRVLTTLPRLEQVQLLGDVGSVPRDFEELAGMTGLDYLYLYGHDVGAWLTTLRSAPPALHHLFLINCLVPADPRAFSSLPSLDRVDFIRCLTPDGTPVARYDIPDVDGIAS
ncbi:NACHT domain-containing protein [Streptomyces sp. DSM 44915]|uniref:NACHT domain-containing protein n=1 Tax=Streptomyces chisholmiae TaxID=3075540 RepID=A0ABU2JVM8_9ACTN|nr:NACHT domain-containing protein [Streptomyces sp. DSM 44915]MDT0269040.1 NACHT domain-containing protein [Streptomyces sp. DSM 44915]